MKKHYRTETNCLNCGNTFTGHFCNNCGQENLEVKEDFGHLMVHAIGDYFHFDEKFFHTLRPLLFKPGKLTVDYMAGKRSQYLHPIRMYIFISLVYFVLLFSHNGEKQEVAQKPATKSAAIDTANRAINDTAGLTPAQKKRLNLHVSRFNVNKKIKANPKNTLTFVFGSAYFQTDGDTTYAQYQAYQQKLPADKRDGLIDHYTNKKFYEWRARGLTPNEAIKESFSHNFPKLMFLLLPLFALFLKITFGKNKKFYIEHLIYSFHLHCFIFLFLTFTILLKIIFPWQWVPDTLDSIGFFVMAWYVYRSLRVLYNRSPFRTITKMIGMWFLYFLSLMVLSIGLIVFIAVTT